MFHITKILSWMLILVHRPRRGLSGLVPGAQHASRYIASNLI
jgi:hypothetical protein